MEEAPMTALPDWMVLPPEGLTAEDYESLPEEVCRRIEVVNGEIVVNASPRRPHQRIVRVLSEILAHACAPDFMVDLDIDLRLQDVPLLNRRPDIVVYDATLPADAMLRPKHCLLVVEVVSPSSVNTDRVEKPFEYAKAGIKYFWRVENLDDTAAGLSIIRYHLDPNSLRFVLTETHAASMKIDDPFELSVDFEELAY